MHCGCFAIIYRWVSSNGFFKRYLLKPIQCPSIRKTMRIYIIDGKSYYKVDDMLDKHSSIFSVKTQKTFLPTYSPPSSCYIYATGRYMQWTRVPTYEDSRTRLFVDVFWCDTYIVNNTLTTDDAVIDEDEDNDEAILVDTIVQSNDVPPVIVFPENEHFRDMNGEILNIEVRGTRGTNECYFSIRDVSREFKLNTLRKKIVDKRSSKYIPGIYYKYFVIDPDKKPIIFLTYTGIQCAIITARCAIDKYYVYWATRVLHHIQYGVYEENTQPVYMQFNTTPCAAQTIFNKGVIPQSCVYLFSLGKVKNLRNTLSIGKEYGDNECVYKYGMTNDLAAIAGEYNDSYGKMKGVDLHITLYAAINTHYLHDSKTHINKIFNELNYCFTHDMYKELIIIPHTKLSVVRTHYEQLSNKYLPQMKNAVHDIQIMKEKATSSKYKCAYAYLKLKSCKEKHAAELERKDVILHLIEDKINAHKKISATLLK